MGKSIGRRPIHQSENQTGLERGKTMREKILQAIRKNEIQTYSVTEKTTEGAELYFIKKDLDMRRMKQDAVSAVTITVILRQTERKCVVPQISTFFRR